MKYRNGNAGDTKGRAGGAEEVMKADVCVIGF